MELVEPVGDFAIAKLTAAGEPVASFGSNGVVTADVAADNYGELATDSRGRLYLSGQSFVGCPTGRPVGIPGSVFRFSD